MNGTRLLAMSWLSLLVAVCPCAGQDTVITPDLSKIVHEEGWRISGRSVSLSTRDGKPVIALDGQPGDGLVWLDGFEFNDGTIEVDIKGKDVQGNSFVGIAFRGVDDKTYDAVYFRPFNFLSTDSLRRSHAVQYVSSPLYTWQKLREEFPGKYESRVGNVPDPNAFFHARLVVRKPRITVFVNDSKVPCLVVDELSGRTGGWVGLWTGNYSDGAFAGLTITKAK